MKTEITARTGRQIAFALAAAGCLLLGGCLEQCVVWAPDGARAAVIVEHGLRLCGTDGKLTDELRCLIRAFKEELVTLVLHEGDVEAFEERAAIMEFDAGIQRDLAEALALLDLIRQDPAAVLACWQ